MILQGKENLFVIYLDSPAIEKELTLVKKLGFGLMKKLALDTQQRKG